MSYNSNSEMMSRIYNSEMMPHISEKILFNSNSEIMYERSIFMCMIRAMPNPRPLMLYYIKSNSCAYYIL